MRVNIMHVLILLMTLPLLSENAEAEDITANDGNTADGTPDAELLEFIAAFEDVDGAWVDPMHFQDSFDANNPEIENERD